MKNMSKLLKIILIVVIILCIFLTGCTSVQKENLSNVENNKLSTASEVDKSEVNKTEIIDLGDNVKMEFILISSGSFTMGSGESVGDSDEMPVHKVTISRSFYLGKYEVTQEQWAEIMGNNPSEFKGNKNPVENVSWNDCQIFLKKLSEKVGKELELPTEAQWEYSSRAGTTTKWSFGDNEESAGDYGWIDINSDKETHPIGSKKPNQWGIYDMYGNVQEWCADWYANPYSKGDSKDPTGPELGQAKVIRGGGWGAIPDDVRSSCRNCNGVDGKNNGIGLRCVMLT